MSGWRARLRRWREAAEDRLPQWWSRALAGLLIAIGIVLPFFFPPTSGFMNATIIAVAYAVMALGLNVVVGFAGLLDLGYVAFYALGAYSVGWFASGFFFKARVHVLVSPVQRTLAFPSGSPAKMSEFGFFSLLERARSITRSTRSPTKWLNSAPL